MNAISNLKILEVYRAVEQCERAMPFDPAEARFVKIARHMVSLYAKMNEPPRYFENSGFEAYLSRHTAEEIAGHIRLYNMEWWDCETEERDT